MRKLFNFMNLKITVCNYFKSQFKFLGKSTTIQVSTSLSFQRFHSLHSARQCYTMVFAYNHLYAARWGLHLHLLLFGLTVVACCKSQCKNICNYNWYSNKLQSSAMHACRQTCMHVCMCKLCIYLHAF